MNTARNFGTRHFQALLLFLGVVFVTSDFACHVEVGAYLTRQGLMPKVEFDLMNYLYHAVRCVSSVLGGVLTARFNNKVTLLVTRALSTVLLYASPWLVSWLGGRTLLVLAFLQAVLSGFIFPCVLHVLSNWIPRDELETVGPLVMNGFFTGAAVFFPLAENLIGADVDGSWASVFFAVANMELVWCLAWGVFGAETADRCWYVSNEERRTLAGSVRTSVGRLPGGKLPWTAMLTNGPFVAVTIARFALTFSSIAVIEHYTPTLRLLGYQVGRYTTVLPHVVNSATGILFTVVVHHLVKRNVPKEALRYTANSLGQYGTGLALILAANAQSSTAFFVFMMAYNVLISWELFGLCMNPFDHSLNYVGFITGIVYGITELGYAAGLFVFNKILKNVDSDLNWRVGYFSCGVFLLVGNFIFTSWGSVEIQPYDSYFKGSNKRETSQD